MAPRGTKVRHVRIDETLWDSATKKAESQGTTVSAVIRAALQVYVKGGKK